MWKALTEILDDGLDGQVWADDENAAKGKQATRDDAAPAGGTRREASTTPVKAVDPHATADSFRVQRKRAEPEQDWEKIWEEVKAPPSKSEPETPKGEVDKASAPAALSPWQSLLGVGLGVLAGSDTGKAPAEEKPETNTSKDDSESGAAPGAFPTIGSWFTVDSTQTSADKVESATAPSVGAESPAQVQKLTDEDDEQQEKSDASPGGGDAAATNSSAAQEALTTGLEELEALEASLGSIDLHQHDRDSPVDLSAEALDFDLDAFAEDLNLTQGMEGAGQES